MPKLESEFQKELVKKLRVIFPGAIVLKNDSSYLQGIPDLSIMFKDQYAILEVKKSPKEPYQPNQEFYLEKIGEHTFTATIYPQNENEVLGSLQKFFNHVS